MIHKCFFRNYPESFQRPFAGLLASIPRAPNLLTPLYSKATGQEGICLLFQGSTPFSSVTVAFTQEGWRQLVPAPRDRFKEGILEKSRNLVLLGKETIENPVSAQF